MTRILLFEDPRVDQLHPVTLGRPAFDVNCGGFRLVDLLGAFDASLGAIVRPHLREILAADYPELVNPDNGDGLTLAANARLVPSVAVRRELDRLLREGRPGVVRHGDDCIAAALLSPQQSALPADLDPGAMMRILEALPLEPLAAELPVLDYPHDIIRHHMRCIGENLTARLDLGEFHEVADGVFTQDGSQICDSIITDTRGGPILLEAGAKVGPYTLLQGPALIGRSARVLEHSAIKDGVVLGHTTKVGGEVEASIIEPYTNKQHHGFLGHSYLGSWINLGAGTCNSDLKNTYGMVNMRYGDRKVQTGMQFVGAFIGDYSKSAINTGIFTGKTVGVCSMVYGFVTTNVPSYVNYARLFGQVTATPVEVMVATQARMFARRNVVQRPCDIQLLHDMFDLTRHERELGSVPPEPLSL
jgi:glucose-1-phosphate thymidylyltransferase